MPKVKEVLKKVKKLEIKTNNLVEGLLAGQYHSIFKGRGIEFSEVREYILGDDVRSIDWNVTARFDSPYVKEFVEERDLNFIIAFDISSSNNFGFQKSKRDLGCEIAASLMFAALKNNDNIGLCLFTDHIEKFVKPGKGKKFFLKLLRDLIYYVPKSKKTNLDNSLTYLGRLVKKKSIICIISDFLSENFEKSLKLLKNKHDVILIKITDTREEVIPDIGYVFLEDEESGEQVLVNTADEVFKKNYEKYLTQINNDLVNKMKKLKIDLINIKTTEPFHIRLKKYFALKEKNKV